MATTYSILQYFLFIFFNSAPTLLFINVGLRILKKPYSISMYSALMDNLLQSLATFTQLVFSIEVFNTLGLSVVLGIQGRPCAYLLLLFGTWQTISHTASSWQVWILLL